MTADAARFMIGVAAALAGWLIPRAVARARIETLAAVGLDLAPALLTAVLISLACGRALFAGAVVLALGSGFALADATKRAVLREPVVFSDMSELGHVFTHPHLYLPFAGPAVVIGGALAAAGLAVGLLIFTPPLWSPHPLAAFAAALLVGGGWWFVSREPWLGRAAELLRRLQPSGEPGADAARLGPFAALLVHGVIARAERDQRRAPYRPLPAPALQVTRALSPVVVVQCESFFDARRVSPQVPQDLLPGFDACRARGAIYGRMEIPAWGANTMRAEFAVLTGIGEARLGYDRFNPYHAFARAPLASLARCLRANGYRTLCLHPYDRRFFRRDLTMPALGFDAFLGCEELGGSARPPYLSDLEFGRRLVRILDEAGPATFIFAITMGNHGPWPDHAPGPAPLAGGCGLGDLPQGRALLRYLHGLKASDEMLALLLDELGPQRRDALLRFYGDHQPSLPAAFGHLGFADWASDYILLDGPSARAQRIDLPVHRLHSMILDRLCRRGVIVDPQPAALGAA